MASRATLFIPGRGGQAAPPIRNASSSRPRLSPIGQERDLSLLGKRINETLFPPSRSGAGRTAGMVVMLAAGAPLRISKACFPMSAREFFGSSPCVFTF